MLVEHSLELICINVRLIHNRCIMRRTSCALDCSMRTQVDIVLEWRRDIMVNDDTRNGIAVLISSGAVGRKEADMMTLLRNYNGELRL